MTRAIAAACLALSVASSPTFATQNPQAQPTRPVVREAVEVVATLWRPPPRDLTKPVTVQLRVLHNGEPRPGPVEVVVTFGIAAKRSLRLPVINATFQAPPELFDQPAVLIEMDLDDSQIRIPDELGWFFTAENWTLTTADRISRTDYDWRPLQTNGFNVAAACLLKFESLYLEPGRIRFVSQCRSKLK